MSYRGIDIREAAGGLIFRAFLQDSAGVILATGTTTLRLYELQTDGTLKSYDFNDNTFKASALTTPTLALTHRMGDNATYSTGIWSVALTTLTGFTVGSIYFAEINNTGASPTDQVRECQYGGGALADVAQWLGVAPLALSSQQVQAVVPATQQVVLSATGLDGISAAEPTAKPTTFAGWLMWLVQRQRRATKSATDIVVKTEAGATVTTQAITVSGSDETLGAPS